MYRGMILLAGLAFAAAAFAAQRQLGHAYQDMERYNAMREMSGDSPLLRQGLEVLGNVIKAYGSSPSEGAPSLLKSMQYDVIRYVRMATM